MKPCIHYLLADALANALPNAPMCYSLMVWNPQCVSGVIPLIPQCGVVFFQATQATLIARGTLVILKDVAYSSTQSLGLGRG